MKLVPPDSKKDRRTCLFPSNTKSFRRTIGKPTAIRVTAVPLVNRQGLYYPKPGLVIQGRSMLTLAESLSLNRDACLMFDTKFGYMTQSTFPTYVQSVVIPGFDFFRHSELGSWAMCLVDSTS